MSEEQRRQKDELYSVDIRSELSPSIILHRQIERCNISVSGDNPGLFEGNVRMLLSSVPIVVKEAIMMRGEDFLHDTSHWQYQHVCGVKCGSPDNPIVGDDGERISPVWIEIKEDTDYEDLFAVVQEELEIAGLTWKVESGQIDVGDVLKDDLPISVVKKVEESVVNTLIELRKKYPKLTFEQLVKSLSGRSPMTPVFEPEEEEDNAGI